MAVVFSPWRRALAAINCSRGTRLGSEACSAGRKNCETTPTAKTRAKSTGTLCAQTISSTSSARSRSAVIISRRRSMRSTTAPASGPISSPGAAPTTIDSAVARGEPVFSSTSRGTVM